MPEGSARDFPAEPSALRAIRDFMREPAGRHLPGPEAEDLALAVSEASTNSVQHAGATRLHVAWRMVGGCLEVTIVDDGVFGRGSFRRSRDGGFGLGLRHALTDVVEIREGTAGRPGTLVRLIKCPEDRAAAS